MPRFFVHAKLQANTQFELPPEVVRHIQVLRLRRGENLILFNGNGYEYTARLIILDKRNARVTITEANLATTSPKLKISLGISLIANDKLDLIIQKSIELGVSQIEPLITNRSQRINNDKINKRLEHWQNIIINSSEQCGANQLATISNPRSFNIFINETTKLPGLKLIASPHHSKQELPKETPNQITLLIGPEGGFDSIEVTLAMNNGFQNLYLGNRILRAETAAIAAISSINTLYGSFL